MHPIAKYYDDIKKKADKVWVKLEAARKAIPRDEKLIRKLEQEHLDAGNTGD